VNDFSLFKFSQPDVNGANADVMATVGQYTDIQQQHISDYLAGTGQYAQQGQQWFMNTSTMAAIAGLGGNAAPFGTTITALRVLVTVRDGSSSYRLSAVVAPQGGATINTTNAVNATASTTGASPSATTSLAATAAPSSTATTAANAAAASQSINYPFTVLELLEDDEIPQLPPPPVPPLT